MTEKYKQIILEYIEHNPRTRVEINALLYPILPEYLSTDQKRTKVNHLLTAMGKEGKIINVGTKVKPLWVLKH